jgi:hypothetical protein
LTINQIVVDYLRLDYFRKRLRARNILVMAERSIAEIMEEGQRLTLEHAELLRRSIVGETLTAEETARKAQLEGYLLGLMGQAQAQGVGTAVGTGYGQVQDEDEDEDGLGDLDEEDEDESLFDEDEDEDEEQGEFGFRY